jgi:hypothetical protein
MVARWAAVSAIGASTGMLFTLVIDGWVAAVTGVLTGLGAVHRDRRHGCLPEPWPADPGLYRFVTAVRNLRRHGWTVFPIASGYVIAGASGVFVVAHLAHPGHPARHLLHQRSSSAYDTARLLAAEISVPVNALVTVNCPADEPGPRTDLAVLPARHLARALGNVPDHLSPAELQSVVDRLTELLHPDGPPT